VSVRRLGIFLLSALVALGAGSATAAAPTGPRLAIGVFHPYPQLSDEIVTVGPTGADSVRLVGGEGEGVVQPYWGQPAWSPDGSLLAFTSSFGEYSPVIYVVGADGGPPRLVSKAGPLSVPIFSPDGHSLVFSALRVVKGEFQRTARRVDREYGVVVDWAVMAVDVSSGRPRLLTPWRRHQILTPTSFSPDGTKLAAERVILERGAGVAKKAEAVAVELGGGPTTVLARNAEEPVYSPDGSRVAFVRTSHGAPSKVSGNRPPARSDLFAMPVAGGKPAKLVSVKGGLAWPSWDPSGQRIAFTRLGGGSIGGLPDPHEGNAVMEINADGTCLTRLLSIGRGSLSGSSWQPGPGREAGPIAC
jgi:dipeptidyl aminopeptidase/acylaminoacyl peptidase